MPVILLPVDGTPDALRRMVGTFSKSITKINSDAEAKRAQLERQMEEGLDKAIVKAQAAGDINTVLALKSAKDQFATLTTSDVPLVKNALVFREKKTVDIETARVAAAMKVAKEFNDELENVKKNETIKGNFETAKAIADHQEKLVAWSQSLRSSAPQPAAARPKTEPPRSNVQPEPSRPRMEPPRTVVVPATSSTGASIGFAKAGEVFIIQYVAGSWETGYGIVESPDSARLRRQDDRCVIVQRTNPSFQVAILPAGTKQRPYSFTAPQDGEYALRAWDGMNEPGYFNDNHGSVQYSVQKVPSAGRSVGPVVASPTQQRPSESRNMESPLPLLTAASSLPQYLVFDLSAGSGAERYPVQQLFAEPPGGFNSPEFKTDKLVVRRIDPGTFLMGSPSGEKNELGRNGCEDLHQVTLTKPFYIGVFEVTQKQWKNVMGRNPAYDAGDARPVENVSYDDIRGSDKGSKWPDSTDVDEASFCGLLRSRTMGFHWDLPTEAQWEFSCRAGTTTALNSGKNLEDEWNDKNINNLGRVKCNNDDGKGGYKGSHTTVGSYRPNAWGLYDMHGNVCEWCRDRWMERLGYDPVVDPEGAPSSSTSYRLWRGGAWSSPPKGCRSAARGWYYTTGCQDRDRGFRLVIEL